MRNLLYILICYCIILSLAGCKKKETTDPTNSSRDIAASYFPDTSEKATGVLPSDDDTLHFIEDVDWNLVGAFKTSSSREQFSLSMPEVRNQGKLVNSCVGWAVGYGNLSSQYMTKTSKDGIFSPTYIWNQLNRGGNNEIKIPQALNLVQEQGCCKWEYMPGDISSFVEQPSSIAIANAQNFHLYDCYRFKTVDVAEIKRVLTEKKVPVIISVKTDEGFRQGLKTSNAFDQLPDGRLLWKSISNQDVKFHALLISGYDDNISAFELYNSWGSGWGTKGYAWVNYDFLETVIVKNSKGIPEIYAGFLHIDDIFFGNQEQGTWKTVTANAPTPYSLDLSIKDLSLRIEFEGSKNITAEASHHFGASGLPSGKTFYDANYSEKSQSASINGNSIIVNFPGGVFKGSISADVINGTFTDTSTYEDRNSGLKTYPVILSTPITLNRQQ